MDYRSICKTLKLIERKKIGGNLCYFGLSKVSLDTPKALRKKEKKLDFSKCFKCFLYKRRE